MKTTREPIDKAAATRDPEVVSWRLEQLLAAGFEPKLAEELARECGADLHQLLELVQRGSAPEIAARILAPLDDEHRQC